MFSPEQKNQLLANLDIEGTILLSLFLLSPHLMSPQLRTVPANSNHGSQTPLPRSAIATNAS